MTSIEPGKYLITTTVNDELYFFTNQYCNEHDFYRNESALFPSLSSDIQSINSMYKIYNYDGQRLYIQIGDKKFYWYNDEGNLNNFYPLSFYPHSYHYPIDDNDNLIVMLNTDGTIKFKDGSFIPQNNDLRSGVVRSSTEGIPQIFQFIKVDSNQSYLNKILEKFGEASEQDKIDACSRKDRDTKLNLYESEPCQQEMKNPDFYKSVKDLHCQFYDNPELCVNNSQNLSYKVKTFNHNDKNLKYVNGKRVNEVDRITAPGAIVLLIIATVLLLFWYINRK